MTKKYGIMDEKEKNRSMQGAHLPQRQKRNTR
jgi:hypothetical protein